MPDRASVFEVVQIAKETTSGTATLPNRRLASMSITPTWQVETNQFQPRGYKWDTASVLNREWTSAGVEGVADYQELPYALASLFGNVSPTTPVSLAKVWTFAPNTSAADTPATYTVEAGAEAARAMRFAYGLFTEWGITISRTNGVAVSGAMIGSKLYDDQTRYLKITGTPTGGTFTITIGGNTTSGIAYNASAATIKTAVEGLASVGTGNVTVTTSSALPGGTATLVFTDDVTGTNLDTYSADGASLTGGSSPAAALTRLVANSISQSDVVPVVPTQVQILIATTAAGLSSGTVLDRALDYSYRVSGKYGPIWTINSAVPSYAAIVETDPTGEITLQVGADSNGMDFLKKLRRGTSVFVRAIATGDLIETGQYYGLTIDACIKISGVSEVTDVDGLVAVTFTGTLAHDSTWGKATQIVVTNTLSAL